MKKWREFTANRASSALLMQNELLFDTELKTALERISIIDSSKLILRLSPKTPDKRLHDKKGFPTICDTSKNMCTDRLVVRGVY